MNNMNNFSADRVIEILRLFENRELAEGKSACRRNKGDDDVVDYYSERIAALRVAIDAVKRIEKLRAVVEGKQKLGGEK